MKKGQHETGLIQVRLRRDLHAPLKDYATANGLSVQSMLAMTVIEKLKQIGCLCPDSELDFNPDRYRIEVVEDVAA